MSNNILAHSFEFEGTTFCLMEGGGGMENKINRVIKSSGVKKLGFFLKKRRVKKHKTSEYYKDIDKVSGKFS